MCSVVTRDQTRGRSVLRALVITPNSGFERRVAEALERAFSVKYGVARSSGELRIALAGGPWDLIVCECVPARLDPGETVAILRQGGAGAPLVVVAEDDSEEKAAAAFEAGAEDVLGPGELDRLARIAQRVLRNAATGRNRADDQFGALLESSPDATLLVDASGRIAQVNRHVEEIFGYAPADLLGQPVELLVPDAQRARHAEHRRRYSAQPSVRPMGVDMELRGRRMDGTEVPIEISISPLPSGDGTVCAVRDVTERKRADRLLRQLTEGTAAASGAEFMQTLVRSLAEALEARYAFVGELGGPHRDRVRVVSFWNVLEHVEPFEYPLEGTPCSVAIEEAECFYPQGVQDRFPLDDALVRLGVNCYLGVRLHSGKGEPLGLLTVMDPRPIRHEETARSVVRIFAARAGVELERLQTIRELERSKERFTSAFRSNPLGAVITRVEDGRILNANDALCDLFGYTQDEMAGRTTLEMGFWVDSSARERAMVMLHDSGALRGFEHEIRRKSGEIRVVQDWLEPIELEGEPCLLGSMLDVTERRRSKSTIARLGRVLDESLNEIYMFDVETLKFVQVNEGARRNLGYTMDELRELTPLDLKPELDAESFGRLIAPLKTGVQRAVSFVTSHRRKDGSLYPVEVRLQLSASERPAVFVAVIQDVTERNRAEQALRENEAQLRLITENVPAMIAYIDRDCRVRFANRRYAEFYAGPGKDVSGWHVRHVLGEEGWSALGERFQRVLAGESDSWERLAKRWDGERRHLALTFVNHRLPDGAIAGVYTLALDITERKKTEESLRESEARFRDLTELSSDWYWEQDENFRFVDMGDAPTGSSPLRAGGFVGKTRWEVHAERLTPEQWAAHRRQQEAHETFRDLEYQRPSLDGRTRWVSVSGRPVFDANGRFRGYRGIGRDITERKRAEEALRLRDRALESSVNAIMITDATHPDSPIIYVNPAFERNTGYSVAEALGRNPRFLLGADTQQAAIETLRAALREQREASALLRNYRKDGTLFWNELRIAPVRDDAGRTTHFVGVQNDVTERVGYQAELERQANFDSLTGLANRNLLNDRLRRTIVRAERAGRLGAVLFLDLDRFKVINDSQGHVMGDRLLMEIGARLAQSVRGDDTVARTGGDEFVILLTDVARERDIAIVAQKLLGAVSSPVRIDGREFLISTSIGVSVFPKDGSDPETLLKHADVALYRAKESGRGSFAFFAAEMNERAVRYFNLENDLRGALEREEFLLYYQPIISIADGTVTGAEALLRWRRESGEIVSPADFIPVAEESGLIVPIGAWVVKTAAAQMRAWNGQNGPQLEISVNLSARQFRDPGLVDTVREVLDLTGLEPRRLKLEITESAVMHNAEEAIAALRALKGLGVRLSVDDFGTGYSSLSYLKRLPIDDLKIDRSFVSDLPRDPDDVAITRAVISLAHSLELEVVAEGVETAGQRDFLRAEHCDRAQGYLFSKPVDAASFAGLLAERGASPPAKRRRPAKR